MRETKIGVKSRVGVSPKLAVGVMLVVIGAVFGAVAFNALVPTFLTTGTSNTVMADIANSWTYVYGSDKQANSDFDNLTRYIESGARVKVVGFPNTSSANSFSLPTWIECDRIKITKTTDPNFYNSVECTKANASTWQKMNNAANYKFYLMIYRNRYSYPPTCEVVKFNGTIFSQDGGSCDLNNQVKWYVGY